MAERPELDETGGMKDRSSRPHPDAGEGQVESKSDPADEFEEAKDGKANNKQQSGQRWWARWRS